MWAAFDLLFISMYQNFLVLAMCLPGVACIDSAKPINAIDIIAILFTILFLLIETIADEQQWKFYKKKKELLSSGLKLDEIEAPYNKGFNTTGLWGYSRHPNYLGEQGMWLSFYIFVIAGASTHFGIFNWSIFGSMLIVLLFLGSSTFSESVSKSKYPEYSRYQEKVSKYIPFKKYE